VVETMPGHHRIKAGTEAASAAVDFVEAMCGAAASVDGDLDLPFGVVTRQFGPRTGDRLGIGHGKPSGRLVSLGEGEVAEWDAAGTVTVRREMSPGGTYDALGTAREAGDVAVTKFKEGRWWYATVYRDADGNRKGTYVNVCTPVEIFPETVRYVDLHVDVVKHGDGTVERVDDDELDAAEADGDVPSDLADRARSVASAVENAL
jgi:Ribonuclease G/E